MNSISSTNKQSQFKVSINNIDVWIWTNLYQIEIKSSRMNETTLRPIKVIVNVPQNDTNEVRLTTRAGCAHHNKNR